VYSGLRLLVTTFLISRLPEEKISTDRKESTIKKLPLDLFPRGEFQLFIAKKFYFLKIVEINEKSKENIVLVLCTETGVFKNVLHARSVHRKIAGRHYADNSDDAVNEVDLNPSQRKNNFESQCADG
jgi:hypothetical protein